MSWPKFIPGPSGQPNPRAVLAEDCHAVRLRPDEAPPEQSLSVLREEGIALLPGAPATGEATDELAVYRLAPDGPRAVATGRVYIRFAGGARAEAFRTALAEAGYLIESIPAWAPNTCWVTATSASAADALSRLDALSTLPNIAAVEPQLLLPREFKEPPAR